MDDGLEVVLAQDQGVVVGDVEAPGHLGHVGLEGGGLVGAQSGEGLVGGAVEGGEVLRLVLGRRPAPQEGPPGGRDGHLGAEQLPQPLLAAPLDRGPDPRRGWEVAADGPEQRPDVAVGDPVDHADAAAGPADPQQLAGRPLLVGGEHGPAGRQDRVEGGVGEGQGLGVGLLEGRLQPFGGGALAGTVEQRGHVVDAGDLAEAAGGGQGGVAVAAGHVQHALAGAQVDGLAQQLGGEQEPGADGGVVAGGPGGLLALLDGGDVHGVPPVRDPGGRVGEATLGRPEGRGGSGARP